MNKTRKTILLFLLVIISVLTVSCGHVHEFGEWVETKTATCKETGLRERLCSCGEKQEQIIPIVDHDFILQKETATCTEDGEIYYECSICGEKKTTTKSKLGHDYVGTETTKATCKNDGVMTYICSRCKDSYTEKIPKTQLHSWVAATCKSPKKCSVCGLTEGTCAEHAYGSNGICTGCGKDQYKTITVKGVHFKIPNTPFIASEVYENCGKTQLDSLTIEFFLTYNSYSIFNVVWAGTKIGGEPNSGMRFSYSLCDENGYTISSGHFFVGGNIKPGEKVKDQQSSFDLPHVSGDLKKGETYRLVID